MAIIEIRKLFDAGAQDTKSLIGAMDAKGYPREVTQAALTTLEKLKVISFAPTRSQEGALSAAKEKADREFVRQLGKGRG